MDWGQFQNPVCYQCLVESVLIQEVASSNNIVSRINFGCERKKILTKFFFCTSHDYPQYINANISNFVLAMPLGID